MKNLCQAIEQGQTTFIDEKLYLLGKFRIVGVRLERCTIRLTEGAGMTIGPGSSVIDCVFDGDLEAG